MHQTGFVENILLSACVIHPLAIANAPCVTRGADSNFWQCVEKSNRSTERQNWWLKNIQEHRVDTVASLYRTDIKLHIHLCNVE